MNPDCACGHLEHEGEDCPEQVRMGGDLFPCGCDDYVPSSFSSVEDVAMSGEAVDRQRIFNAALEVYTEEGVRIWMASKNRMLDDQSPNDLIDAGESKRVLDYIENLTEGNFA